MKRINLGKCWLFGDHYAHWNSRNFDNHSQDIASWNLTRLLAESLIAWSSEKKVIPENFYSMSESTSNVSIRCGKDASGALLE